MLSKFLSSLIKRKGNADEEARVANLPKHEQARLRVQQLATRKGRAFNPIKASTVEFQTIDKSIDQLILRLLQYADAIENDNSITPASCFAELSYVSLDRFFTDEEGMYIPLVTFNVFVESCERLFTAIDHLSETNKKEEAYTLRLLTKSFVSIKNICKAVEEVGQ